VPSQAGCIYYLHHFSCQAFLQFFLNLFLTDTADKTNSNCAKTYCSSDLPNTAWLPPLTRARILQKPNKGSSVFSNYFVKSLVKRLKITNR
jgi:hypothetical protein